LLESHLISYAAKNTYDFFIHKNLEEFLNHELDFYIKNELLNIEETILDNIEKLKINIIKAKVFRQIASKIIWILVQFENF
jgi:adenine-specific DNA-methyltransferase